MKCIVVIGTYNEAENIPSLLPDILELGPQYEAVVVDDNSPDGTGRIVSQIAVSKPRIHLVERAAKLLGPVLGQRAGVVMILGAVVIGRLSHGGFGSCLIS